MEELSLKALKQDWAAQATRAEISRLLPNTEYSRNVEMVYRGRVLVVVSRLTSRGGGIVPSLGEIWELYVISGPDKAVEHLAGVNGSFHTNRHIGVHFDEMTTLLGSDVRVAVTVPDSMKDPRDPPPAFLIHVEGEGK